LAEAEEEIQCRSSAFIGNIPYLDAGEPVQGVQEVDGVAVF
jgi:hypothetical protein